LWCHLVEVETQHASRIRVGFHCCALLRATVQIRNAADDTARAQTKRDEKAYRAGDAQDETDGLLRVLLLGSAQCQRILAEPLNALLVLHLLNQLRGNRLIRRVENEDGVIADTTISGRSGLPAFA